MGYLRKEKTMATVKVRLGLPSEEGRHGTVFYQVTHRGMTRQIMTPVRLAAEDWDASGCRVVAEGMQSLQDRIDSGLVRLRMIIWYLDGMRREYTVDDIVYRYGLQEDRATVMSFMDARIGQLISSGRLGTARNYIRARNSLAQYLGPADVTFVSMTKDFVSGYGAFLQRRGLVRNSISFYMRIWRAVYNLAVKNLFVEQAYPFSDVYTGVDRTRKRAVGETVVSRLFRLDLSRSASLTLARDMFLFSYCTRGMAFVDMAYLRKDDIRGGSIHYIRRKTGQPLCVRMEPCIRQIVDRYADRSEVYVFPMLKSEDPEKTYARYQVALNYYNRQLKQLGRMLHLDSGLTSYVARHSWATAARNHNIPVSVISAAMGHQSEKTTQIYLAMLEDSVIDSANQEIISCIK